MFSVDNRARACFVLPFEVIIIQGRKIVNTKNTVLHRKIFVARQPASFVNFGSLRQAAVAARTLYTIRAQNARNPSANDQNISGTFAFSNVSKMIFLSLRVAFSTNCIDTVTMIIKMPNIKNASL